MRSDRLTRQGGGESENHADHDIHHHVVVGVERGFKLFHTYVALGPVEQSAADRAIRLPRGGDALVTAAMDQAASTWLNTTRLGIGRR